MSIYASLFTYRPMPSRFPLEDFLSEALADLLNRLPRERHVAFVADVLLKGAAGAAWLSFMESKPDAGLEWTTQRGVKGGRNAGVVDMLLLVDGRERLVVENKVGAAVREYSATPYDEDAEQEVIVADANQLTTYGAWLARRCQGQEWPGALVLLTHRSEPPRDYGLAGYGVPHAAVCRWREVWRWARDLGAEAGDPAATSTVPQLASEFAAFLEKQRMGSDHMTQNDIAQAQVFVGAADRITSTFKAIEQRLQDTKAEIGSGNFREVSYQSAGATAWAWFYLRMPTNGKWYFSWGMRFPESSTIWNGVEPPLPSVPHAFVTLGTENTAVPVSILQGEALSNGWAVAGEHELIIARKLSDFPSEADALTAELADWVLASVTALQPTLSKLVRAALNSR